MLFLCRHLAINRPQGYDTFRQRIRRFVAWQILDQPGDWRCAVGQNPAVVGRDGWEMLKYGNFWSIWNCDMNLVTVGFCGSIGKKLHVFAGVLKMPAYQGFGFGDSNGLMSYVSARKMKKPNRRFLQRSWVSKWRAENEGFIEKSKEFPQLQGVWGTVMQLFRQLQWCLVFHPFFGQF